MERVIIDALESQYEKYFFIGEEREKKADGGQILDVELSEDTEKAQTLFAELQMVDEDFKWWLLDATLKVFSMSEEDDYQEFRKHVKMMKRERLQNSLQGKLKTIHGKFRCTGDVNKVTKV